MEEAPNQPFQATAKGGPRLNGIAFGVRELPMNGVWAIAPDMTTADISNPPTFEEKLTVFERSVLGWQLKIADAMINGSGDAPPITHSGYAVLSVVASYPEMVWQFVNGTESAGQSKKAFQEGMQLIFPSIDLSDMNWRSALDLIYDEVRCGMYHDGKARRRVVLSHQFTAPIELQGSLPLIKVNPHLLPRVFINHLRAYVAQLRQSGESSAVVRNFTAFFDAHW